MEPDRALRPSSRAVQFVGRPLFGQTGVALVLRTAGYHRVLQLPQMRTPLARPTRYVPMNGKDLRETLGLIAVVASLGFVGFEIRQNTAAVESTAFQSLSELLHQSTSLLAVDRGPGLTLRLRDGALPEDFTPEEDQWVRLVHFQHINVLQAAYHQVQVGALDEDALELFWTGLLSLDYIREAWPSMRYSYDPEFADFFEELLVSVPQSRGPRVVS